MEYFVSSDVDLPSTGEFLALYEASFPSTEREPISAMQRGLKTGRCAIAGVRSDGRLVGFCYFQVLIKPISVFIVYIAIGGDFKGRRIGAELMQFAVTSALNLAKDAGLAAPTYVWFESEICLDEDSPGAHAEKKNRLRFFERQGFLVEKIKYIQPPVDGISLVPMQILGKHIGNPETSELPMSEHISALFFEKYQALNGIESGVLKSLLEVQ